MTARLIRAAVIALSFAIMAWAITGLVRLALWGA